MVINIFLRRLLFLLAHLFHLQLLDFFFSLLYFGFLLFFILLLHKIKVENALSDYNERKKKQELK